MEKYKGNWELARSQQEEWRLARDEYRQGKSARTVDAGGVDNAMSEVQARFRRLHPNKRPIDLHTLVFVNQSALQFGSNAHPPRTRRPVIALRKDIASSAILGAPMTTKSYQNWRKLAIPSAAPGLNWLLQGVRKDGYVYDTPEYVPAAEVRRGDPDSPLAVVEEPLLGQVLAFVYMPPDHLNH